MSLSSCGTKANRLGRELREHGTATFPIACYHDDLAREHVPWHWHDEMEAVSVTEGTAIMAVGTEKYTLRQGDGFFINAGVLHAAWNGDCNRCRFHSLVFHPRLVGGGVDSVFWQNYVSSVLANPALKCVHFRGASVDIRDAVQAVETAWQACVAEPAGYEFLVRAALSRLIFLLSGSHATEAAPPSEKVRRDNTRMKLMLEFIQAHICEPLNIAEIARSAMISESECLRCFRGAIGTSPIQYLKQLRIRNAAEFLCSTNKKIVDISEECGFRDASYFSRCFREQFGCTPFDYRKNRG